MKVPISNNNPNQIKFWMLQEGLNCKQLEGKIQSIQRELKINNHKVDNGLNEHFIEVIISNFGKITSFMKLFWEQHKRLFTLSLSWAGYHPVIFRFYLSVAAKSLSV